MSSKKPSTRDRILETTLKLLESGGGNSVRMSDIAKAVGISRQALYLHFPNRADLLVATTRYVDEINDIDNLLANSRNAPDGRARLSLWIEAWGSYIPVIQGVARALLAMKDSDPEAEAAWNDRMQAVRHGCAAVIEALSKDAVLTTEMSQEEAVDFLWTILSVRNWEQLCLDCGWTRQRYVEVMQLTAEKTLLRA